MPAAPSVGTLTRFGLDTANPVTKAYEYTLFTLGKRGTVLATEGIRGTRSHPVERTRAGTSAVGGRIVTNPGPADLDAFLPLITGGTPTGAGTVTFPLGESLTAFYVGIDRVAQMYTYAGCKVNRAVFKASQGCLLELALDIEGLTETPGTIAGFNALTLSVQPPYVLMDAVLTYGGTAYQFREWQCTIDNHLKTDRFMNATTRTDLPSLDRTVEVVLKTPFTSDTLGLYDQNATAGNVVVTFTNGVYVLTFTTPAVQFPTESPRMPGREEILLPLRGVARKTGATLELTITNKSS